MNRLIQVLGLIMIIVSTNTSQAWGNKVFLESGGQVVVEAENFTTSSPSATHEWFFVPTGGIFQNSRGEGYVQALPDNGSSSGPLQPPLVEYKVRINTIGTYRLYARWDSNADQSDSFYASVLELKDGSGGSVADWYRYASFPDDADFSTRPWHGSAGFERTDAIGGETSTVWAVMNPGDYSIRFDMREDGAAIDAFVFQLSTLPAPTGDGPPESAIVEDLAITSDLSAIKVGKFSSQQLKATGGVGPYFWSVSNGALPSNVELTMEGVLSGTPEEIGELEVTIEVTDSNGDTAEKTFNLQVVFVLPPSDIRINKAGTIAVPGRALDQFIVVENNGPVSAFDLQIIDYLDPSFELLSVNPSAVTDGATLEDSTAVLWDIGTLAPGDSAILIDQVKVNPSTPFGQDVGNPVCNVAQLDELVQCLDLVVKVCEASTPLCIAACAPIPVACTTNPFACAGFFLTCRRCLLGCSIAGAQCFEDASCSVPEVPTTGPIDPNEKLVVTEKFIQPDELLVFPIHFENIGEVEALDVFLTDVLDSNLDLSTLKLLPPEGGSLDEPTRTVRWELIGRNLQPGETDNVLLAIKPLSGLPSGTEIRNKAEIQFEIFDPLITNEVVNIIDSTLPSCSMNPLPLETPTLEFPISWTATDEIGEIESLSVFVSENGGGYKPFVDGTTETSALFIGEEGVHYAFLCVAKDTAGNIENQSPSAEAETRIVLQKTVCSYLGNDPKPSLLDQDIFRFKGKKGEIVTFQLEKSGNNHVGDRATLRVQGRKVKGEQKLDRSDLPNKVVAEAPRDGYFKVTVAEQPLLAKGKRFRGDYCLTMEATDGAEETLEPLKKWVEP